MKKLSRGHALWEGKSKYTRRQLGVSPLSSVLFLKEVSQNTLRNR